MYKYFRLVIVWLLERFGSQDCEAVPTPMVSRSENIGPIFDNASKYRAIIGNLVYLIVGSRLGVAQSVSEQLSRYCSAPKETHWIALKRLLRYSTGTTDHSWMEAIMTRQF
ncbi:hypothetical protein MIR68_000289 [Amoeboaphelidium protococcarum]|nr:hypothetical protein MIR68_000289 [Amoeboaphelidium protococcarum]